VKISGAEKATVPVFVIILKALSFEFLLDETLKSKI
jgi:hypothetical protein